MSLLRAASPLPLSLMLVTIACSSGSSASGGDGGTGSDARGDVAAESGGQDGGQDVAQEAAGDDGSSACNSLSDTAPMIQQQNVNMAAPTPKGGTIPDGTYFASAYKIYTGPNGKSGPTGATYAWTTQITGQTYESNVLTSVAGQSGDASGTVTTSGPMIIIQQTCPQTSTASPFSQFDSDGTNVTIYAVMAGQTLAITFTKQ